MTQEKLNEMLKKHEKWLNGDDGGERADLPSDLRECDLVGADLRYADLHGADLRGCDLRGADLDFSCLPLWCGGLDVNFDDRQIIQIAYHLVRNALYSKNVSPDIKRQMNSIVDLANKFHRVEGCGMIKEWDGEE